MFYRVKFGSNVKVGWEVCYSVCFVLHMAMKSACFVANVCLNSISAIKRAVFVAVA